QPLPSDNLQPTRVTTNSNDAAEPQPKTTQKPHRGDAEYAEVVPGSARFQRAPSFERPARRMRALPGERTRILCKKQRIFRQMRNDKGTMTNRSQKLRQRTAICHFS